LDERRIDAIARFLDVIQTRRGTLRQALAGVLALAVAAGPDLAEARNKNKKRKKRKKRRRRRRCPGGQTRCFGSCTDTNTDPRNCGFCGVDCDEDEVCTSGQCVESGCDGGLTRCGNACVNTNNDPQNCGGCGNVCEQGELCRGGLCVEECDVCDDDEECPFQSVQAAVDAASPDDIITICKGTYTGNVTIDKNLTLNGVGADDVTLKGEGEVDSSVVIIESNVTAAIRGVSITGGTGTLANGFLNGGGVLLQNVAHLTLTDCVIHDNQADPGAGIFCFNVSSLTLDNTRVEDNHGSTDESAPVTFGGGIYNRFGVDLQIHNGSEISRNRADIAAGIYNQGVLTLLDGSVVGNEARLDGGGIVNDQGNATIGDTTIRKNTAQLQGGGIHVFSGELVLENNCTIEDNESGLGGGISVGLDAILSSTDATIRDNNANQDGGGLYNHGGVVNLERTVINGNEASARGGGIFNAGSGIFQENAVSLKDTHVTENEAGETGGGIFNDGDGIVEVDAQSSVTDNDPNNCVGTDACEE
jgi:nitrous oxidase accessory protein NosD